MEAKKLSQEEILNIAVKIEDPEERAALLDAMCGEDKELRAEVESLLKAHEEAGDFLAEPAMESNVTLGDTPLTEGPGTVIGKYKLLELIGEGGMGVVYMAEQKEPIRRKVALKIIKLGMDTKQVIARFEVERQALALMDHPNIARVLDAGATDTGRPYFVMELVRGIPITEYCDKSNLSTRERLDLFIPICQAIQHAHQKGIIHRDIKPTNIMVTLHDSKPVPKIIDFGIAKATNQQLTEKTLFTRYAQMVGTPEYMSPEQAEMSGLDIDTRSDIYSLGVLLYELLTGSTPLDADTLRKAGYNQMQKIIREEEPAKPSTKLSTLGKAAADIAKHRSTQPDALRKLVKGDLDWVVMKALDKERTRRYANASDLAADVERHLNHEPVTAAAPSITYKLNKFTRRNRSLVASAATILIVLIAGIVTSTMFAYGQRQASLDAFEARKTAVLYAQETDQQRIKAQGTLSLLLRTMEFLPTGNSGQTLSQTFDLLETLPFDPSEEGQIDYRQQLLECFVDQALYLKNGDTDKAEERLQKALTLAQNLQAEFPNTPECQLLPALIHIDVGSTLAKSNQLEKAEAHFTKAVNLTENLLQEDKTKFKSSLAQNYFDLAVALWSGNLQEHFYTDDFLMRAINYQHQLVNDFPERDDYRQQLTAFANRAQDRAFLRVYDKFYYCYYNPARALELALRAKTVTPESAVVWNILGTAYRYQKQLKNALEATMESISLDQGELKHYNDLQLAVINFEMGKEPEARDYYDQVLDLLDKREPKDPEYFYWWMGEAEAILGIKDSDVRYPQNYWTWYSRGHAFAEMGKWEPAISYFAKALEKAPDHIGICNDLSSATVAAGDIEQYRLHYRKVLDQFGSTRTPNIARLISWYSTCYPDTADDWDSILKIAEIAHKGLNNPKSFNTHSLLGCVLYRAGEYDKALVKLEEAHAAWVQYGIPRFDGAYVMFSFLAMTHQKLGHDEQAQKFLDIAINTSAIQSRLRPKWLTQVHIDLNLQEAKNLIRDKTTDRQEKP